MDILQTLLNSAGGGALKQVGQQLGVDDSKVEGLLGKLLPALTGGIQRNAGAASGIESLQNALAKGNHQRYIDDPSALADQNTVDDGNKILGHLFGSKDVSRQVASQAAEETGLDLGMIKKFLPIVAAAAMGALSKQTSGGSKLAGGGSGAMGMLTSLLGSGGGGVMGSLLKKLL